MAIDQITLGLSMHRPELISFTADRMRHHDAVFLEEPPTDGFEQMLTGALAVKDYLKPLDVEFPAFSTEMCFLMRELKSEGIRIFQIEPYLEILLGIHEFFAKGHGPEDLDKQSAQYPVYLAERNATGALLAFYKTALTGSFDKSLAAVKSFARLDAARFRLRDSLRAQALAPLLEKFPSAYIEAGVIHYSLWRLLRQRLSLPDRLQLTFITRDALSSLGIKGCPFGPGDRLTLMYIFQPNTQFPEQETILAARSLIYSKLIVKEELTENPVSLPHLRNELACIRLTNLLSLNDCRHIFPLIHRAGTSEANQIVADYISSPKFTGKKDLARLCEPGLERN
jgi:hypothetical protein